MMKSRKIYWLASYPKSGNTWVRAFLSAYLDGHANINAMGRVTGDNNPYFYSALAPCPLEDMTDYEVLAMRNATLCHILRSAKMEPLILKTHHACANMDDISLIPQGLTDRAVYVVRDPRAVALSFAKHFGKTIDEAIKGMNNSKYIIHDDRLVHVVGSWSDHVKSWVTDHPFKVGVVPYEDLWEGRFSAFRGILGYYSFTLDDDRIRDAIKMCSLSKLRKQEEEHGFTEKKKQERFFDHGGDKWKEILTKDQQQLILDQHGEVMEKWYDTRTLYDNGRQGRDEARNQQQDSAVSVA